jgi:hypothetical protein
MLRRRIAEVTLIAGLAMTIAQAGGPIYSRFGIGDLYYFASSRSYAMGGAGVGLFGDGFINRINPAGLAGITNTRFSGTFEYSNYSSTDPSGSARYARGDFGGLSFAIPVSQDYGVVLVGDLTPYSLANYAVSNDVTQLGITSNQRFYGSGGISRFDFGSSISIVNSLHAGFKINYLAGTILQTTMLTFADNSYSANELTISDHYSGISFTFGTTYQGIGDLFGSVALKPLVLGIVVEAPASLDLREEHFTSTAQQYDTTSIRSGTSNIPPFVALGASYTFADRYIFAADLALQDWSNAKTFGVHPAELRNSMRVSTGFEILPAKDASTYWGHVIYRAGFYYNSSYIQVKDQIAGVFRGVDAYFLTAGLGLPIGPDSHLNLGFQFGVNGTTQNSLQKDTIFRIIASISASELWFVRIEED